MSKNHSIPIKISIIISTYNWPEALELLLMSFCRQSMMPHEIIIADDGSDKRTQRVIQEMKPKIQTTLIHSWHPDDGYRKTKSVNRAIKRSTGNYLIQVDHDVILHRHFIKDHLAWAKPGCFVRGCRAKLSDPVSQKILKQKRIKFYAFQVMKDIEGGHNLIRFLPLRNYFDKESFDPWNILGCNMAFWKQDFMDVNGYHNQFTGWGHDDTELMSRMVNMGIKKRELKFAALQYHLYHPQANTGNQSLHYHLIKQNVKEKTTKITDGIRELDKVE